ncbi:hypothetical protein MPDQ_004700 [Monascus purpureus]|uniref:Uncharacterized protein n=1 Tax=Monascus purpureus TaxID=5098 RepID=A0A507QH19_MONPU|nr:hypothetical protein MPDQ_004700 [Monascus purpureus]BDD60318.1 hypothetical protein MAP00_005456 [Monascus purpureus]
MPGVFYYVGPEEIDLAKFSSLKDELLIEEVDESKLSLVHQHLKECRIDTVELSGWNCQGWALEGLEKLRADGFIYDGYTREIVKAWLKEK